MSRPPAPEVKPVGAAPSPLLIGGVVLLVIALIGGIVLWAVTRGSELEATGSQGTLPEGGGIVLGAPAEADVPSVQVYEDFQCPWCGVLETSVGEELTSRAQAGEITVTYTLMSFLDGKLGNDSSHRAANAALCADDAGAFAPFHAAVFAGQPAQEGTGWTDEQLLAFAADAGLAGADLEGFTRCVQDDTHGDYVEAMQERANRDGITGTPTVLIDGERIADTEMQALMNDPATLDQLLDARP